MPQFEGIKNLKIVATPETAGVWKCIIEIRETGALFHLNETLIRLAPMERKL